MLFDPPYSPRQVFECYRKLDMTVNMKTTQASFWPRLKAEIGRTVKYEGVVVTRGWHNDTIATLERKAGISPCF